MLRQATRHMGRIVAIPRAVDGALAAQWHAARARRKSSYEICGGPVLGWTGRPDTPNQKRSTLHPLAD